MRVGTRVRHPLFGIGVVESVTPRGGSTALRVAFKAVGSKTLIQEFARLQVIGCLRELLVAPQDPAAVIERIAAAATRIVSLTITDSNGQSITTSAWSTWSGHRPDQSVYRLPDYLHHAFGIRGHHLYLDAHPTIRHSRQRYGHLQNSDLDHPGIR
jgi:fructuronate reductase